MLPGLVVGRRAGLPTSPAALRLRWAAAGVQINAEFLAHMREPRRVKQARVGHGGAEHEKARVREEQPWPPPGLVQAQQPAGDQAGSNLGHLGLALVQAARLALDRKAFGNAGQRGEEHRQLSAYVVPFGGCERAAGIGR